MGKTKNLFPVPCLVGFYNSNILVATVVFTVKNAGQKKTIRVATWLLL